MDQYVRRLEQVKAKGQEVVLCAHGQAGLATVDAAVVLDLARAILDAERVLRREDRGVVGGDDDTESERRAEGFERSQRRIPLAPLNRGEGFDGEAGLLRGVAQG